MSGSSIIFITIFCMIHISNGLYIKPHYKIPKSGNMDDWNILKEKYGLTNENETVLRSQQDLLLSFQDKSPNNYMDTVHHTRVESERFLRVYKHILERFKLYEGTLKTSVNFVLGEKPVKNLRRRPRKIAVKMISEITSEKIDDLIKVFNEKYGIDNANNDVEETDEYYTDFPLKLPSATDPDYMYENLYEDETDLAIPAKSRQNSEYGSFQDLILQATRNQWQRETDETKLHIASNKRFI